MGGPLLPASACASDSRLARKSGSAMSRSVDRVSADSSTGAGGGAAELTPVALKYDDAAQYQVGGGRLWLR